MSGSFANDRRAAPSPAAPFTLLKLFPHDDADFAACTEAAFRITGERGGPLELQRILRERYPSVRVRLQERLGMNGEERPHWYVFRDGRIGSSRSSSQVAASEFGPDASSATARRVPIFRRPV